MTKNIENFPEPNELISLLHGNNFSERRERLYNLLRAFDGDSQDDHRLWPNGSFLRLWHFGTKERVGLMK
jgi:hypothetical protein